MDLLQFYLKVVTDEINTSGIADDTIRSALTTLCSAYSSNSLQKGETVIDYNSPANRCAYVYKFCTCHTSAVETYCKMFLKECFEGRCIAHKMLSGSRLQLCFLGGGPGTDLVGLLQALSDYPHHPKALGRMTVIDAYGGWRNTFNKVIENLRNNVMSSIPSTLLGSDVILKLIQADLLKPLTTKVENIIRNADIVFMVRFVSIIAAYDSAESALENVMKIMKPGAVVFMIDNVSGFEAINSIVLRRNLNVVFGPFRQLYRLPEKFPEVCNEIFGCYPLLSTKTCAMVWKNEQKPMSLFPEDNISNSSTPSHSSTNSKLTLTSEICNQSMPTVSKNAVLKSNFATTSSGNSSHTSMELINILSTVKKGKTSESLANKSANSIGNTSGLHSSDNQAQTSINSNQISPKVTSEKLKAYLPKKDYTSNSAQDFVGLCKDTSTPIKHSSQLSLQELISDVRKISLQGNSNHSSKASMASDINLKDRASSLTTIIQPFIDSRHHLSESKYCDLSEINVTCNLAQAKYDQPLEEQTLHSNGNQHDSKLKFSGQSTHSYSIHCQSVSDVLNSTTQHYQDKSCQTSEEKSSNHFDFLCSKCANDQKTRTKKFHNTSQDNLQQPFKRKLGHETSEINLVHSVENSSQTIMPQNAGEYMNNHRSEEFFNSLTERLDQIVSTFEDIKNQLSASTGHCTCDKVASSCHNWQTCLSPVKNTPFLVLPLQHMEQGYLTELFSALSKPED